MITETCGRIMKHPETLKTETVATDDRKKPLQRHRRIAHDEKVRKYEITGVSSQGFTEKSIK